MSVSGIGSGIVSTAPAAAVEGGVESAGNGGGGTAGKVSPDGEFASLLAKSYFDNQKLMKQIFDPVKDATDEGSE
ncbi:hypothetical protein ACFSE1_18960 [Rhizobium helianthi]|uniref:Uncharacterized protein n=1 Tax=Rhizobium helianthi TaxID=1132695 RepID=A0ABW4M9S4_9HYPH